MTNQILITQFGLDDLKAELAQLVDTKRPALVERLSFARSMGDLSENSDYISAREELDFIDSRIEELEELIKNSKVVTPKHSDKVDFGHSVEVKMDSNKVIFKIVGEQEADPKQGRVSYTSPIGQALMGKKVGDHAEVDAPVGKIKYTVLSIG